MTIFEEIPALSPLQFFALSWDCPYLKGKMKKNEDTRLPVVSDLSAEESFAELYMAWNEDNISMELEVKDRTSEDVVELFFDTRDLKTKSHVSKFCHHFLFTPDLKEGSYGKEITRFYGDDLHPLCNLEELIIEVDASDRSYRMKIELPSQVLFGYDPRQFPRIGFTYKISRGGAASQHFAVSSEEFSIEQHPSLWATLNLVGG